MTDAGEDAANPRPVNQACQQAVLRGFLAGGVWQGVQMSIIWVADSRFLPDIWRRLAPYSTQPHLQIGRREKAMPIYVAIIEGRVVRRVF